MTMPGRIYIRHRRQERNRVDAYGDSAKYLTLNNALLAFSAVAPQLIAPAHSLQRAASGSNFFPWCGKTYRLPLDHAKQLIALRIQQSGWLRFIPSLIDLNPIESHRCTIELIKIVPPSALPR
jgi:hypothetical protein